MGKIHYYMTRIDVGLTHSMLLWNWSSLSAEGSEKIHPPFGEPVGLLPSVQSSSRMGVDSLDALEICEKSRDKISLEIASVGPLSKPATCCARSRNPKMAAKKVRVLSALPHPRAL